VAQLSAYQVKARALLRMVTQKDETLSEEKVLELVKAVLSSSLSSKRELAREIGRQAEQVLNNQRAIITSAAPLSKDVQDQVLKALQKQHQQLRSAEWRVDPQLLGGFTIQVGDTWYDTSIAHDLFTIREQLSQ